MKQVIQIRCKNNKKTLKSQLVAHFMKFIAHLI